MLTTLQAGRANKRIPDDEVLAFATQEARTVLTLNRRDFIRLHKQNPRHSGIIACTADADYVGLAQRILAKVDGVASLDGELVRINKR